MNKFFHVSLENAKTNVWIKWYPQDWRLLEINMRDFNFSIKNVGNVMLVSFHARVGTGMYNVVLKFKIENFIQNIVRNIVLFKLFVNPFLVIIISTNLMVPCITKPFLATRTAWNVISSPIIAQLVAKANSFLRNLCTTFVKNVLTIARFAMARLLIIVTTATSLTQSSRQIRPVNWSARTHVWLVKSTSSSMTQTQSTSVWPAKTPTFSPFRPKQRL